MLMMGLMEGMALGVLRRGKNSFLSKEMAFFFYYV